MSEVIKSLVEPIALIGMGVSGRASARLLHHFSKKKLVSFDRAPGAADTSDLELLFRQFQPKTLVVSPGIPLNTPSLQDALSRGVHLTSEVSLAFSCLNHERIIAVTGSVGKSTTTVLLAEALRTADPHSLAVGNIGYSLADYVVDTAEGKRSRASWLALELSSYQLENFENLRADHSVLTFFTPNHLERYSSLEDYYESKWTLVKKTAGFVFANSMSADLVAFAKQKPASRLQWVSPQETSLKSMQLENSSLLGAHNQQNLALAAKVAQTLNLPEASIPALKNFPGLPHRFENLGVLRGVQFINDSKATALDSVLSAAVTAAERVLPQNNLFLLLGGRDKNLPWPWLKRVGTISNLRLIYFGEVGPTAKAGLETEGPLFKKLGEATSYVLSEARPGDTVLLSPGGTSLDEFKSFEERGEFFRKMVFKN